VCILVPSEPSQKDGTNFYSFEADLEASFVRVRERKADDFDDTLDWRDSQG